MTRRRLITGIATCALTVSTLATPAGRVVAIASLVHIAEVGAKILRLPRRLLDHDRCFTLDRFDPTCPHCF